MLDYRSVCYTPQKAHNSHDSQAGKSPHFLRFLGNIHRLIHGGDKNPASAVHHGPNLFE